VNPFLCSRSQPECPTFRKLSAFLQIGQQTPCLREVSN
jgi:hypothetical protein